MLYIDHCTGHDRAVALESLLDTRAKHLDLFFSGMRAIEIAQSGAIGRYITECKREGAANASVNREKQVSVQMFRRAAAADARLQAHGRYSLGLDAANFTLHHDGTARA